MNSKQNCRNKKNGSICIVRLFNDITKLALKAIYEGIDDNMISKRLEIALRSSVVKLCKNKYGICNRGCQNELLIQISQISKFRKIIMSDIRNQLSIIIMSAGMIKDAGDDEEKKNGIIDDIIKASYSVSNKFEDYYLKLSKMDIHQN